MSETERRRQLEVLFVAHAAAVRGYAARRVLAGEVDDVASEVFVVAWRRLDDVPDDALPWLLACARRIVANRVRAGRRQLALRDRLGRERGDEVAMPRSGLADSALARALATLSAADREALMLVAWEGLDHRQGAVVMGCSPRAFSMRVHRARGRLAAAMSRLERTSLDPMEALR
jgi:RNA polymerase sigma-70 factor (ECF subfamily)